MNADEHNWLLEQWLRAVPASKVTSVSEWARHNVILVGSARSTAYVPEIAPWQIEPLECADDPQVGKVTVIKPVQCGGTVIGEVCILYWLANWNSGDICYYWPNNESADERFEKHFDRKLKACKAVMDRLPADRHKYTKGQILFPHCNFVMQGASMDRNVASDSFRAVVNEEIHISEKGWLPGRLNQTYGRTTAHWNAKIFNISNASYKGDQLYQAWLNGTRQEWTVKCPRCNGYHVMHAKLEHDGKDPKDDGLWYDADGCRSADGTYDYTKLKSTIYYQFPCGCKIVDDREVRRKLCEHGKYSEPTNPSALLSERSYRFQAVAVYWIPWLTLIQEKHLAGRACKRGDDKSYCDYVRERESEFWDAKEHRAAVQSIILSVERKKSRAGLPNKELRVAAVDYQQGIASRGETEHYWAVVQDFDPTGNSLIVWEGRCADKAEVVAVLKQNEVDSTNVVVDVSKNQRYLALWCLEHGYHGIKIEGSRDAQVKYYLHEDGSQRVYSTPEPLWRIENQPDWSGSSSCFWKINKWGAMERLAQVRASKEIKYEVPGDVSEAFKQHNAAWQRKERRAPLTNELQFIWHTSPDEPDHLYQCCAYLVTLAEMEGLVGQLPPPLVDETAAEPALAQ